MTILDATSALPPRLGDWKGTDRYQVRRLIGAGSMGTVYEAFDRERGQPVALKRLRHFSPAALYLFKQEFRSLVDVVHPNLVRLYELVATDPHDIFFAMELVRGAELLQHVHMGDRGDTDRLRGALRQLVEGVQALHAAGKLHRDIKPSNVLVTPEGRVVLLDFGVATEISGAVGPKMRDDEAIVGTAAYMAPEQAAGEGPTTASDWYSVGAILYEALAGRTPFVGSVSEVLQAKVSRDPEPPSRAGPDVPPDLDALCRALLQRPPAARPSGPEILRWLGIARRERGISLRATPEGHRRLVGRGVQLAALTDALGDSRRAGVTVQISGPSGMGKSALLQEFVDDLVTRGEGVVLKGRAYERESVPYKAIDSWVDALSRYLLRLSDQGAQIPIPEGAWALARLFPVLRRVPEIADAREKLVGDPQRLRRLAFGALREILTSVGRRHPLVVCVDDAHWGDADSAALLVDLIRPPGAPPLLLVMTHREEERASVFLASMRTKWPSGAEQRIVAVGPLDAGDARALALALLGPEEAGAQTIAEDVARESEGSPFLIEDLVRSHQVTVAAGDSSSRKPLTLEQSVWARLDELPEPARHIFELVAVGGRPLAAATLATAAKSMDADEHVELLRARRFVRVGLRNGLEAVEATHARIAEAVVGLLPAARIRSHHADLARVLEATAGSDPESVALHLIGAGDKARAGPFAERAAEDAVGKLAFDQAAHMFRLALDAADPASSHAATLRLRLAEALAWAGRRAQAARVYLQVAEGAQGIARLELELAAADQLLASGRIDEGGEALRRVLSAMGMRAPHSTLSALFWLLVYRVWLAITGLRFTERETKDVRHEDRVRLETMYAVAMGFSVVDVLLGACVETRFLIQALRSGDRNQVLRAAVLEAGHRASLGGAESKRERALFDIGRGLAARIGDAESDALVRGAMGLAHFLRGRWKQAREELDASTAMLALGVAHWQANGHLFAANSCYFTGELKELSRRHARLSADAFERGDLYTIVNLATTTTITMNLVADSPEEGRRQVREALKQWSQSGFFVQQWQAMVFEPDIDLYAGDGAASYDRLARDLPALRRSLLQNVQFMRALTLYSQGRCAVASVEARPALREARIGEARRCVRRLSRERMPWVATLLHTVEAATENVAGNRPAAVAALKRMLASAEATDMGMHACAARHRLGELLGGDEGRALVGSAQTEFASEGIRNPAAMLASYLPGRWE